MTKKGRLPHTFAPAAVKNVVKPIQKARKPMIRLAARSMLTLYFWAMRGSPGVTIGPRAVVTPELKARKSMVSSFLRGDQFRGSLGLEEGWGIRMVVPERLRVRVVEAVGEAVVGELDSVPCLLALGRRMGGSYRVWLRHRGWTSPVGRPCAGLGGCPDP